MSSDADLSARVREPHDTMPRSVSDAEPSMNKVIFTEHTTVLVSLVILYPLRMVDHHRHQHRYN